MECKSLKCTGMCRFWTRRFVSASTDSGLELISDGSSLIRSGVANSNSEFFDFGFDS